jgi:hypothetical protein
MSDLHYNALDDRFYGPGFVVEGGAVTRRMAKYLAACGATPETATDEELDWAEERAIEDTLDDLLIGARPRRHVPARH